MATKSSQHDAKNKGTNQPKSSQHNASIISRGALSTPAQLASIAAPESLEQPFRPSQVTRRPNICQRKVEPVSVLIRHRPQLVPPILHAETAAIPVI